MKPLFVSIIIGGIVYAWQKLRKSKGPPDPTQYPEVNPFSVAQLWGDGGRARRLCQTACHIEHGNTIIKDLWIYHGSGLVIVQGTAYQKAQSMGEIRKALGFGALIPVWAVWTHFPHNPDAFVCNCEQGWVGS